MKAKIGLKVNKNDKRNRSIQNPRDINGQRIQEDVQRAENSSEQKTFEHFTNERPTSSPRTEIEEESQLVTLVLESWSGILQHV